MITTKQVIHIPNPEGKGGFQERPQDRSDGRWKPENSQSYCLNKFLHMTEEELANWWKSTTPKTRTVAQVIAYERVIKARKELPDYKEVADRTEGKSVERTEISGSLIQNTQFNFYSFSDTQKERFNKTFMEWFNEKYGLRENTS